MLFLLTGDVQIGKTRWLQDLVAQLSSHMTNVYGVLAPGVWRERTDGLGRDGFTSAGDDGIIREKVGIDNVLLPGDTRIPFARRRDIAEETGTFREGSQSAQARLVWEISDTAIARVNEHLSSVSHEIDTLSGDPVHDIGRGLLVIDELGRLELMRGGGLTEAMALLDRGPNPLFGTAIVIVRDWLLTDAKARFGGAWPEQAVVPPSTETFRRVVDDLAG